jgi:hypothetical protein
VSATAGVHLTHEESDLFRAARLGIRRWLRFA